MSHSDVLPYSAAAPCAICHSRPPETTTEVRFVSGDRHYQVTTTVTAPVCRECKSRYTLLQRMGYGGLLLACALFFLRSPLGLDVPLRIAPFFPAFPGWLALGLPLFFLAGLPVTVFEFRMKKRVDAWRNKYLR